MNFIIYFCNFIMSLCLLYSIILATKYAISEDYFSFALLLVWASAILSTMGNGFVE
jgi:hypothetical protein